MLNDDCQTIFDVFVPMARDYLESPGIMAALELDKICMQLYPMVARNLGNMELSNRIRDFGRNLPRKNTDELRVLFKDILSLGQSAGLKITKN
ncbi:MAG TPA: hypothetical protein ENG92_06220 [Thiolapillus brandeum]|uniref:Uncharacterized protein n=1 Tax=Thiolapillus brandeum TaxID=1076588 RepID=A0A831KCY6_9GAMM|nr:hypothetical protein [Thiolapillus brandeum]